MLSGKHVGIAMTFKEYIAHRQVRDNQQGDFVLDARADSGLSDVQTWPELRSYLESCDASYEDIEVGHLVWQSYQAKIKRAEHTNSPKGQKRSSELINAAIKVARIATGEEHIELNDEGKSKAAVELGRKGGKARAKSMSAKRRKEIARNAAAKRWGT